MSHIVSLKNSVPGNRHPVDRLADIRDRIRGLEAEEAAIRDELLDGKHSRVGEQWVATVKEQCRETLDATLIREHFGLKGILPFIKRKTVRMVRLTKRET